MSDALTPSGDIRTLAARIAAMDEVARWRDRLESLLLAEGATPNGWAPRVASVLNVSLRGWRSDILIAALDVEGVCASAGAACSSGVHQPSPVLHALYPDEPWRADAALRLSLGPEGLSEADIDAAIPILKRVLGRARPASA